MRTFADNAARTWAIAVNTTAIKRVRNLLGVNLLEIADQKSDLLQRLVEDPVLLCDILFALVQPEAEAKNVTDEDFGRALGGDVLDTATDALLGEIADFFPKDRREILRRVLEKLKRVQTKTTSMVLLKLTDPRLDAMLDREIEKAMNRVLPSVAFDDATSLPASSESIPVPTPSES